ncbi:hypothetical protein P3S67_006655 [Capsicum chacoense]
MVLTTTSIRDSEESLHCTFASRYVQESLPKFKIPERSMPKEAAFQIVNDELMLDGNPRLNLASFVSTWMEPECDKHIMLIWMSILLLLNFKNRSANMLAHLFHAPVGDDETALGVGTVGSSEAIMLAGLAFKRKWPARRKADGKPFDKPNIVTGANKLCFFAAVFLVL